MYLLLICSLSSEATKFDVVSPRSAVVRNDLLHSIERTYPELAKSFMGKAVKSERGFRGKVGEMDRWSALGTTVGWIAVALGDYLPMGLVSEASQTSWRSYLESYMAMRETFLPQLASYGRALRHG